MTAKTDWKSKYTALESFVAAHPEIRISAAEISIPKEFREEFYRRFDAVRRAVVAERYPAFSAKLRALRNSYIRVENETMERLRVERIAMPVDLSSFLRDPKEGLVRTLYNRLFDLIQGKTTVEAFEQQAEAELNASAYNLFRLGYEPWAVLALIALLEPDQSFLVDLDDEYRPFLGELKEIAFGRQAHHPWLRVPEFVIRSKRVDKYIAIKIPLSREVATYFIPFEPPVKPKKRTGDTSSVLDSRVLLLSFMPTPKDIPVIADLNTRKITSPDLIVEFVTKTEAADPDVLAQVQHRIDAVGPKLGTCLVIMDPGRKRKFEKPADCIDAIAVGFNASRLQAVVDKLL